MNVETGDYYENLQAAVDAGEKEEDLVEVQATEDQIRRLSDKIKMAASIKSKPPKLV